MNKNPSMQKASENLTFILTGKLPEKEIDKHKRIAKEISEYLEEIKNEN